MTRWILGLVLGFVLTITWAHAQGVQPGTAQIVNAIDAGCTPYHLSGGTGASTNSNEIKGAAARLCFIIISNTTSTTYYLHLYDVSTAPTCSSSTNLKHTLPGINGQTTGYVVGYSGGEIYTNGIGYCVTGGGGDGDNTNAATGVYIEAGYRTVPP